MSLICQRYKFESNPQPSSKASFLALNVAYMSKIQIWKQSTTKGNTLGLRCKCRLYVKDTNLKAIHNTLSICSIRALNVAYMSKIQIWKQSTTKGNTLGLRCKCRLYVKDTNLKAIHNTLSICSIRALNVAYMSKIQIWKQSTTVWCSFSTLARMSLICQRYKFESNPQLRFGSSSCCSTMSLICQRYKFVFTTDYYSIFYR